MSRARWLLGATSHSAVGASTRCTHAFASKLYANLNTF